MKNVKDIKKEMSLPPIPTQPPKTQSRDRDRNRVRIEMTPATSKSLLVLVEGALRNLTFADPDFEPLFSLYNSIKAQQDKVSKSVHAE